MVAKEDQCNDLDADADGGDNGGVHESNETRQASLNIGIKVFVSIVDVERAAVDDLESVFERRDADDEKKGVDKNPEDIVVDGPLFTALGKF